MNVAAFWERYTQLALWPRGVRSVRLSLDSYVIHSLICQSNSSQTSSRNTRYRAVCVHGLGSSGAGYGSLLPELISAWDEVWAPSAPGHGLSPSIPKISQNQDKRATQHELYLAWEKILLHLSATDPIDLIAVSLGGAVSIRFAAQHPDRVRRLILCSPAGARLEEKGIEHLRSVFRMSEPGDGLRFMKTLYHQPPWWSWMLAPLIQKSLSRPEAQNIIKTLKPGDGLEPEEIQTLPMPVLLIWGGRERVLPSSSLAYFEKYAPPHFSLQSPPQFSHSPQRECPKELAQVILEWLHSHKDLPSENS